MARIRTIKPSFWGSPEVNGCQETPVSPSWGSSASPTMTVGSSAATSAVSGYVYPNDDLPPRSVRRWMDEAKASGLTHEYEVDGVLYGVLPLMAQAPGHQPLHVVSPP